jgi:hypothetical protein
MTLPQPPSFYIKRNIAITTSGVCSDASLRCALDAMGESSVMFSVDYPFEKTEVAAQFIDNANISETERIKVASDNAKRILRLDHHIGFENTLQIGAVFSVSSRGLARQLQKANPRRVRDRPEFS